MTSGIRDAIMRRSRGQRAELDFIDVTGPSYHLDVLRDSISVKCIDTLGEVWWETYAELERFKENAGHANAPSTILLGKWCSKQRSLNAKGELFADRVAALDKLGFSWEIHNDAWWENYSQLKRFFEVHGHLNMPKGTGPAQWWYAHQRKGYKAGELQPDRIAALNAIGFSWAVYDNAWQNAIQSLTQFVAEHGHADVLQSTLLGRWLYKQKHTHKKGQLAPERVAELEALGVRWNIVEEIWWNKLKELTQFKDEHGHADAPQDTKIGGWASSQRAAHKRGSLSPDKIAAMEAIGFKWHIKDDKWWCTFDELKQYAAEHGHCTLPALTRLGAWSHKQRCAYRTEKLPQIKIEALESIGFKWFIRNRNPTKIAEQENLA